VRIVADTNTILSGLLWQGPPRQILDRARAGVITLHTSLVLLAELAEVISRDADDDHVLACALAAGTAIIVSGDRDLLDLGTFRQIRILTAQNALAALPRVAP
jgi:uncharacterized protein